MLSKILFTVLFFAAGIFAQVPNGDFEQWSGGQPVGWSTFNNLLTVSITQTSDSHSGSSAAKGATVLFNSVVIEPILIAGDLTYHGFPVSQRYTNITGYYKLTSVGNDLFNVVVGMWKNGQAIGAGALEFNAASSYTAFSVPIYYATPDVPDSCWISFTVAYTDSAHLGTVFYVDDVAMNTNPTSVNDKVQTLSYKLIQNYPNPFNPTTVINYEIPVSENVTLTIYNSLGQQIKTLVDEHRNAGYYQVAWNGRDKNNTIAPSGIYFYRIQAGNFIESKKMILLK